MSFLDLIFPKTCLWCGKSGQYICPDCLGKVQFLKPACPYCEKPSIDGFTHTKCKKRCGLDGLISVWKYQGVVKKAITSLKYKYATEIVQELCGYYVPELNKLSVKSVLKNGYHLVPIPIHWHRKNDRGFNQSEEIGSVVAHEMGWKFEPDLLIRIKSTTPQAGLSVEDRRKNLRGVFSVNSNIKYPVTNILLFDDVFTTGSTLHEACKILKRKGVEKVWGMTIAR